MCRIQAALLGLLCLIGLDIPTAPGSWAYSPTVQVRQIEFQEVNAATRLVLNLNGSPKDVNVSDQAGQPMTVSFAGNAAANALPLNRKFNWPNLSGVYADQH